MTRWHAMLEYIQFPLKVLFVATMLLSVGNAIINPNVAYLWEVKNEIVIMISEIMRYSGGFLIRIFPLLVFVVVLTRKFEDSVPVFIGLLSYIVINLMILFLNKTDAPSYFYGNMLGMQISFDSESIFGEVIRIPYNTGIFSLLAANFITMYAYRKSRHYTMHGMLSFIDHDAWAMLLSIAISVVCGIMFAYGWALVILIINNLHEFLAKDLINPMNLFIYGVTERLSAIFGLQDISREAFWFSELGGSATDSFGVLYPGDVNAWYAMQNLQIVTTNAGHLITPYYVINIFLVPGFLLGYLSMVNEKKDRKRYLLFFIIAILLSVISGNALPMEILMLVLAPMLYLLYLIVVGFLFAGFQMMGVAVGYWFKGSLMVANPGSMLDLLLYFRNPEMSYAFSMMAGVGVVILVLFFFATRFYFSHFAIGLFNFNNRREVCKRVIEALGGLNNIRSVSSTPDKMTVALHHRDKVNFNLLRQEGAYLILEAKEGYLIRLGNLSTIIAKEIKKELKRMS